MSDKATVPFMDAEVGDEAYTYQPTDRNVIPEYGWITDLEWFDERDDEIKLRRLRWKLISEDEVVLPNPYGIEDDEMSS